MKRFLLLVGEAHAAATTLIEASAPFSLEPWPDEDWILTIKIEHLPRVETRLRRDLEEM